MFPGLKLIDRYIFSQVFAAVIFGIIIVVIFWISPEILFKVVRRYIAGDVTFSVAIQLLLLEIPEILTKAIPVGLMVGSLLIFDRLSKDSELTIMRMSGISTPRLMIPVVLLGIVGAGICYYIHQEIIPYSSHKIKLLKKDIFQGNFVFVDKDKNEKPRQILIVGGYYKREEGSGLYNIKLLKFSDEVSSDTPLIESIITAETAEVKGDHWELLKGIEYEIAPNGVYKEARDFEVYDLFDEETAKIAYDYLVSSTKRPREMNDGELTQYLNLLKTLDMDDERRFTLNKYYQRFSQSFGCILLAVCGVLLGISRPRENRLLGFTIGAALIFAYYISIPPLDMLTQVGAVYPALAAWFPNLIALGTIIALVKYKSL